MFIRDGMTPKQVRLMNRCKPINSNEFFAAAAPISHGKVSISVYLADCWSESENLVYYKPSIMMVLVQVSTVL